MPLVFETRSHFVVLGCTLVSNSLQSSCLFLCLCQYWNDSCEPPSLTTFHKGFHSVAQAGLNLVPKLLGDEMTNHKAWLLF